MARGKGEGSIYRRSDGRWVGQIEAGRDANGRRRYARVVRRTRRDALDGLHNLQRQVEVGIQPGRGETVATFLDAWLTDVVDGTVSAGTSERYRRTVRDWITPHVGDVRLTKLTPADVQAMMRRLREQGLSPKSVSLARDVLARALRWAEQTSAVHRNVAAIAQGPKAERHISDALDADQARAVLAQAEGDRLEALAVVALRLGLRRGEALGLRWEDVDFDTGELTVRVSKTAAGARTVPLVAGTAAALREHRRRQAAERLAAGPLWRDSGYLFTNQRGEALNPRIALRWWHQLTEAAGVGRRRFHASRHTCAVLLLDQGVPLEVVSAVLGHANLGITSDIYARVTRDSKRRALATLDNGMQQ